MSRRKTKKLLSSVIIIAVLFAAAWQFVTKYVPDTSPASTPATGDGKLIAAFLDVDQGDCELFYLPDGKVMLIDAGNRGDGDEIVDYLKDEGVTKIDYLVATHPHADHIGGISDVIDELEIGQIFAPKIPSADAPTSETYNDFITSVQNKGLKITAARHGTTLFEGEDYSAQCFSPCGEGYESLNDYSVTVKLTYGVHSFLLTGDAEKTSEAEMLRAGYDLDCDVLKIGHHGSSTSSSEDFLNAASPKYAVISCGTDNSYGHPHKETVTALENLSGLEATLRTDLDQTIIFTADGKTEDGLRFTTKNPTVVE